jgi:hypothetical protein
MQNAGADRFVGAMKEGMRSPSFRVRREVAKMVRKLPDSEEKREIVNYFRTHETNRRVLRELGDEE